MTKRPKRLLDAVRETIRLKHYSPRTEQAYVYWVKRYVLFHNKLQSTQRAGESIRAYASAS